jgi:hypothetical protein
VDPVVREEQLLERQDEIEYEVGVEWLRQSRADR